MMREREIERNQPQKDRQMEKKRGKRGEREVLLVRNTT